MLSAARRVAERLQRLLLPGRAGAAAFRLLRADKPRFECPLCRYRGPFLDMLDRWGGRAHALCPRCGANERVRLQYLVIRALRDRRPLERMSLLHFSPERQLQASLRGIFGAYRTAGIWHEPVDFPADLTRLPFADASWDCIFASHVLEHVADDERALREIRRVLRPGGIAVLPVPVSQGRTEEYAAPDPLQHGHVRAPGMDYFERYRRHFAEVEIWSSSRFAGAFQLHCIERAGGARREDYVPVCYV